MTDSLNDYFEAHTYTQWGSRVTHSDGTIDVLWREDKADCLEDLEDFAPGRVEIVSRQVTYGEWEVHDVDVQNS